MTQNDLKKQAAEAALAYVKPDTVIGVGTGSTVNCFIALLATIKNKIAGAVATSKETDARLNAIGISTLTLNETGPLSLYIDGADEIDNNLQLIKGGGGALTREKIVASASRHFVCIADISKKVNVLGKNFPLPIEVIPMARSHVARELVKLGGTPVYREGFITDNGNVILDVHNLKILSPLEWETRLNNIPGVVTNGLFALHPANTVLLASENGLEVLGA